MLPPCRLGSLLYMRRNHDKERGRSPGSRVKGRSCIGFLLVSALLAGMPCHATSKDTNPSCSEKKAAVGQETKQAANVEDSTAVVPDYPPSRGIKLTWDPSASPKRVVAGYNIFRCEIGPDRDRSHGECEFKQLNPHHIPIIGSTCTDYDVQPGHTYIYEAQTVGSNTRVSTMSNRATATAR